MHATGFAPRLKRAVESRVTLHLPGYARRESGGNSYPDLSQFRENCKELSIGKSGSHRTGAGGANRPSEDLHAVGDAVPDFG